MFELTADRQLQLRFASPVPGPIAAHPTPGPSCTVESTVSPRSILVRFLAAQLSSDFLAPSGLPGQGPKGLQGLSFRLWVKLPRLDRHVSNSKMTRRGHQWPAFSARLLQNSFFAHHKPYQCRSRELPKLLPNQPILQRQCVRYYDQNFRTEFLRQKSQQNTVPPLLPFAAQPYARKASGNKNGSKSPGGGFSNSLLKRLLKFVGGLLAVSGLAVAGAPYLIPFGSDTVVYLINQSIPGTLSVESVSLGWREPVRIVGLRLKGSDSNLVLSIAEYTTSAHLWSLVAGRSGLGDAVVVRPTIDWRKDPNTGHLYFDLSLTSVKKLNTLNPYVKRNFKVVPSEVVPWNATMHAPGGNLEVVGGKVVLDGDVAAVLGPHLHLDFAFGSFATGKDGALWEGINGRTPLRCSLSSDCAHLEGVGYYNSRKRHMELLKPLTAEMDLSPAFAKFYLAQINPILGQIVGPSISRDDLPDVVMHLTPDEMVWASEEYFIRIEPMKVVLAKGYLLHDLLRLLSREDLESGNRQITMQTSAIEANVRVAGSWTCSRVDLLITDKVHVATWGLMDHVHETMKMTLAIPGKSLRDLLGLTRISPDFYLQIPINGSIDRPQVDCGAAGRGLASLTVQEKMGDSILSAFLEHFDDPDAPPVPKPIGPLPWAQQ